jgi:hypothetical protein
MRSRRFACDIDRLSPIDYRPAVSESLTTGCYVFEGKGVHKPKITNNVEVQYVGRAMVLTTLVGGLAAGLDRVQR